MRTVLQSVPAVGPVARASAALCGALLLPACNAPLLGNLAVFLVTIGIFLATLGLGRSADDNRTKDPSASSSAERV